MRGCRADSVALARHTLADGDSLLSALPARAQSKRPSLHGWRIKPTGRFLESWDETHEREETLSYRAYFLGPIVTNTAVGHSSWSMGSSALTTLTLLLIYLLHLQTDRP